MTGRSIAAERHGGAGTPVFPDVRGLATIGAARGGTLFPRGQTDRTSSELTWNWENDTVAVYKTSEFRKGLKVQIDGEPYLMIEMNFVKPGKGNALYKCKLRNLIRNTVIDRTYKGGDSLEAADVEETEAQFLYRQGDTFVFMDSKTFEQYELSADQVGDNWKYLKDGMVCNMVLFNGNPITVTPPNHVVLKVEYCEPGAKGDTATNVTKPVKVETGAEFPAPIFINMGDLIKIDTRTGEYVERVKS
ncbi:MAG TPA: elongation factor P [Planctomycetaceae bacterium]|nr:elongation factor P [Planctomycetaceae bacterium]